MFTFLLLYYFTSYRIYLMHWSVSSSIDLSVCSAGWHLVLSPESYSCSTDTVRAEVGCGGYSLLLCLLSYMVTLLWCSFLPNILTYIFNASMREMEMQTSELILTFCWSVNSLRLFSQADYHDSFIKATWGILPPSGQKKNNTACNKSQINLPLSLFWI